MPSSQELSITSWNEDEVVATTQDGCKVTTLTITPKEAFQTYRYGGSGNDPHCAGGAPRIVKLVDANKFSEDYYTDKEKEAESYYSKGVPGISGGHTPNNSFRESTAALCLRISTIKRPT